MARRDSPPAVTLYLDDQQPPSSQTAESTLPTPRFISSILTVSIGTLGAETRPPSTGQTRQTGTPSPSSTAIASTSSTDRSLPVAAVVAVTVSAAFIVFAGVFIMFACRRRAAKRKRASAPYEAMTGGSEPSTPRTDSTSPSTSSSLSTQALIDLGLCGSEMRLPLPKIPPPTSSRQSIDTATAFNFYQPERQLHHPSVTELPATPLPRLAKVIPLPSSPPRRRPVTLPLQVQPTSQKPKRKMTNSGQVIIYRNPSGELWKPVSPPAAPLPALPTTPASVTTMARRSLRVSHEGRSRDLFSLFPRPQAQSQSQLQTTQTQHARYNQPGRPAAAAAASHVPATTAETAATTQASHPIKRNFSRPSRQPTPSYDNVTAVGRAQSTPQTAIPGHITPTSAGVPPTTPLSKTTAATTAKVTAAPQTKTETATSARLSRPFLLPDRTHSLAGRKPFPGRARGRWWGSNDDGNGLGAGDGDVTMVEV